MFHQVFSARLMTEIEVRDPLSMCTVVELLCFFRVI